MSVNTEVANSSLPLESLWGLATVAVIKAHMSGEIRLHASNVMEAPL